MSIAERAALLEKQHLKECEESDYQMLEGLFQARASVDDTDDSYEVKYFFLFSFVFKYFRNNNKISNCSLV